MTARRQTLNRRRTQRYGLGLATIVVLVALVVVAFRSNSGLPFQARYRVTVDLPNAHRLAKNDAVRLGGIRVGRVSTVRAELSPQGPVARVVLDLDPDAGPLPADTHVRVRQASVLGASYVDVRPGTAARHIPNGGRLRAGLVQDTVQLTDLLDVFERHTAASIRRAAVDMAGGFAARGPAINAGLHSLVPVLGGVARVSRLLAAPSTRLGAFITEYAGLMRAILPVRDALASLLGAGGRTFAVVASERASLRRALLAAPGAEAAVTDGFAQVRPSLDRLLTVVRALRRSAPVLRPALRQADAALRAGTPALEPVRAAAPGLRQVLRALDGLARRPSAVGSLRRGRDISAATGTTLDVLTPAQVHCNVISLWGEDFANGFGSLGFHDGPSAASVFLTHLGADNEMFQNARPSKNVAINNTPNENAEECEAGNEDYTGAQQIGNPAGLQAREVRQTRPPRDAVERARSAGLISSEDAP